MSKIFGGIFCAVILMFGNLGCSTLLSLGKDVCTAVVGGSKAGKLCDSIKVLENQPADEEETPTQ